MNQFPNYQSLDKENEAMAAEFRSFVHHQLKLGAERMTRLEEATDHNTEVIVANTADTKALLEETKVQREETTEMLEIFKAVKGGLKVMGWIGLLAKWGTAIAAGTGLMVKFFWPESK